MFSSEMNRPSEKQKVHVAVRRMEFTEEYSRVSLTRITILKRK